MVGTRTRCAGPHVRGSPGNQPDCPFAGGPEDHPRSRPWWERSGASTANGLWERDLNLDVAKRLQQLLIDAGFEVALTRERDETVPLREWARFVNRQRTDLFFSIHFNALAVRS
jgi:hypothetical protein